MNFPQVEQVKEFGYDSKMIIPYEDEFAAGASCGLLATTSCVEVDIDGDKMLVPETGNGYCKHGCGGGC